MLKQQKLSWVKDMSEKPINLFDGAWKKRPNGFFELDHDRVEENEKKAKAQRGSPLLEKIYERHKSEIYHAKKNFNWFRKMRSRLERLNNMHPKQIYIWGHTDIEGTKAEGCKYAWEDVEIALPTIFRRLHMRWITTILAESCFKSDLDEAIRFGSECPVLEPEYPQDNFDVMYVKGKEEFNDENDVIEAFKKWRDFFLPNLKNVPIVWKEMSPNSLTWSIFKSKSFPRIRMLLANLKRKTS
jgi:hypothetical protein